jgi:hypothetical protein
MMRNLRFVICDLRLWIGIIVFTAPMVLAEAGWMLTTADFRQQAVVLHSIDAKGVMAGPAGTDVASLVPFDQFLQLERSLRSRVGTGRFILHLAGGTRILGEPTGYQDEQVVWNSPVVGELKVSLKEARALVRNGKSPDNVDQERTEDLVQMSNGDTAKGIVTDISARSVKINSGGSDLELGLDNIDWIYFAAAGKAKQQGDRSFRVRLLDGSVLAATAVEFGGDTLAITLGKSDQRKVPIASVDGIEQINGPVSWLSSRVAEQVVQIPYYGSSAWPTRMDLTVGGRPIQFGNQVFARGIGVHSYSRIDYALDGGYEAFRTQYAIAADERRQYADVTVRIKVDGKVVHEKENLRADVLAPMVIIDLPKVAKMLTLEVDYGAANDTQDRFNWIEPALLRKKPPPPSQVVPATKPTTRPATQQTTRPSTAPVVR